MTAQRGGGKSALRAIFPQAVLLRAASLGYRGFAFSWKVVSCETSTRLLVWQTQTATVLDPGWDVLVTALGKEGDFRLL